MGKRDTIEVVIIALYITGAILLLVTTYLIYVRRYRKRGQLKAINDVVFHTSRYDNYNRPTQFLIELPKAGNLKLNLLNDKEEFVTTLFDQNCEPGEFTVPFDPIKYDNGSYFLHLISDSASLLRKIKIEK